MPVIGAIRQRLQLLARNEEGFALPIAVMAMVVGFALAAVAVMSSVDVQHGTNQDMRTKNAIAAADAGANVALERVNRYHKALFAGTQCVGPAGEAETASGGWCPVAPSEHVGSATFTYQISAFEPAAVEEGVVEGPLTVIAVGSAGGISRRIEVGLYSHAGEKVFANEKLIGQHGVEIEGNSVIRTDIGTNGNIEKDGKSAVICGNLRHGIGGTAPEPECEDKVTEGNKQLPPVNVPENIATVNSNCRLEANCANGEIDTYSKKRTEKAPYVTATRTVNVSGGSTLTMGGSNYFICKLEVNSGELIMASGAETHIYFDTPENCGLKAGEPQIVITGSGKVLSTGYNPAEGRYDLPMLFLIGSPTIQTAVDLEGDSSTLEMVIYAPYSHIDIGGNSKLLGMAAGESLFIHGNALIESNPNIHEPEEHYEILWERTHYVECTGTGVSPPNAYC